VTTPSASPDLLGSSPPRTLLVLGRANWGGTGARFALSLRYREGRGLRPHADRAETSVIHVVLNWVKEVRGRIASGLVTDDRGT
jgi:hypothetical protein